MKNLVIDLDGTLTVESKKPYSEKSINLEVVEKLRQYKKMGFRITIFTSRNMRTYQGNIGLINMHTLPEIIQWLDKHDVPCDEVIVGKPWCGFDGFYVDDKAIRPSEFIDKSYDEIKSLLANETNYHKEDVVIK
ncbi:HAD hydrolase family protein [Thiotrichales bacterium 19S3-7]|nr:HAD hydrolase family protein [Thiotrichales bacterium 19S3-7]MCF6800687.1 HAD hydrolase family protein [Thiotrichales bacterium 19S3-11]